jgi:predicted DNA-binding protein
MQMSRPRGKVRASLDHNVCNREKRSMESRKQGVSIRISTEEVEKIKCIAKRLSVRDSDVIRHAIKSMLNRLSPLDVEEVVGRDVVPVFIENGAELARAFELDAAKLDRIINGGIQDTPEAVSRRDIELLMLSGTADGYLRMRVREVVRAEDNAKDVTEMLQQYLYEKYVIDERTRSG